MYFVYWNSKTGFVNRMRFNDSISADSFAIAIDAGASEAPDVLNVRIFDFNKGTFIPLSTSKSPKKDVRK